jgi:hypothetical protein
VENCWWLHLSFATHFLATTLYPHFTKFLFAICCICCCAATQLHAQHPIGYASLKGSSQVATFSFDSLDCEIVQEKSAFFFADEPVAWTFDVLVDSNGEVKYVRAPRIETHLKDVRLACTSALYSFAFAPVAPERGERWFKATMVVEE